VKVSIKYGNNHSCGPGRIFECKTESLVNKHTVLLSLNMLQFVLERASIRFQKASGSMIASGYDREFKLTKERRRNQLSLAKYS
jgi:hypothetical protein